MTDEADAVGRDDDEFERIGRRAGAELRVGAPRNGPRIVEQAARRRRATITTIVTVGMLVIVVTGVFIFDRNRESEPDVPVTVPATPVIPTTDATELPTTPPATFPQPTPGAWRDVADSALAPASAIAAVWTGDEAVVFGFADAAAMSTGALSAVAYDVSRDTWRRLADPPFALTIDGQIGLQMSFAPRWTGSEVLVATTKGEVFAYDPVDDQWTTRTPADESMTLEDGAVSERLAVSSRGVLARASAGWWWYDNSTDRWETVPSPALGVDYDIVTELDQDTLSATNVEGAMFTSAVFDVDTRTWQDGPRVPGPGSSLGAAQCPAVEGLLVCFAETFAGLQGVVIDPLLGPVQSFSLGNHSNALNIDGIPWMTHAWQLLDPHSATWEDMPTYPGADTFGAAVWTGSEIVFFGGGDTSTAEQFGTTAAYTPLHVPGP